MVIDEATVLVHLSVPEGELAGVWVWASGRVEPYYPAMLEYPEDPGSVSGAEAEWRAGSAVLEHLTGAGDIDLGRWQWLVEHLARDTSPYVIDWRAVSCPDATPRSAYAHVLKLIEDKGGEAVSTRTPTSAQLAAQASLLFTPRAVALARAVLPGLDPQPFSPGKPLTTLAHWFRDDADERLVVVLPPSNGVRGVVEVIAYAVAWQQDRDLLLVVPAAATDAVLERTIWLKTPVRVWSFGDDDHPAEVSTPRRADIIKQASAQKWASHLLTPEHREWLSRLLPELNTASSSEVAVHEQASYWTWQSNGMELLHASSGRGGVKVTVPQPKNSPHPKLERVYAGPLSQSDIDDVVNAVRARLEALKTAVQNPEHKLQARLHGNAGKLGLAAMIREYPAWRGVATPRRGFIDFLGIDEGGDLHVVETKVGSDPRVVLQALDYLTWVSGRERDIRLDERWKDPKWWQDNIAASIDPNPGRIVHIDFVLAAKAGARATTPPVNGYLAGQLEALPHDVKWRLWTTTYDDGMLDNLQERAGTGSVDSLWTELPGLIARPVTERRWAGTVARALRETHS